MKAHRCVVICVFFLFLALCSVTAFGENLITFDPATGNYIIRYQSLDPAVGQVHLILELPTKTKPVMTAEVEFEEPATFRYAYEVKNLRSALQGIQVVKLSNLAPVTALTKPEGFFGSSQSPRLGIILWGSFENKLDIAPGESKSGFGFSSEGLPQVMDARMRGTEKVVLKFPDEPPPDIDQQLNQIETKEENRYVKLATVVPGDLPGTSTALQLLDRLMNLKEQALQLGWIDNRGVANSLNKKLDAAKKKLEKGNTKTASNILHAFLHELQAQHEEEKETRQKREEKQVKKRWWEFWKRPKRQETRDIKGGKHINDNAFYLLKANAEFLLFKLGAR